MTIKNGEITSEQPSLPNYLEKEAPSIGTLELGDVSYCAATSLYIDKDGKPWVRLNDETYLEKNEIYNMQIIKTEHGFVADVQELNRKWERQDFNFERLENFAPVIGLVTNSDERR